ncbi:hypothetical protein D9615_009293 [Tricholomella constricta]|uniref:Uncharacterized protein n=1 Tax=Tricholomella constricta TaxID=117010 RepID=A0A8H5LWW8_9AGAR|nr:hypothetical protein D9615_009293 [Tricholomella constricta]
MPSSWIGMDPRIPPIPKSESLARWAATLVVSSFTFISPVSSSMFARATSQVASDFGVTQNVVIATMTFIFVLGYAMGPLTQFLGPPVAARRYPLVVEFLEMSDTPRKEEKRLRFILLPPCSDPSLDLIAERSTWRWVFRSTSIVDAAIQISGLFFLQETYAPLLLERKAEKIRKTLDAEKGQKEDVHTVFEAAGECSWSQIFSKALTRPFALFAREKIVQLFGIYMAFIYGLFYQHLSPEKSIAGLHYIAVGVGLTLASQINARYMDRIYIHFKRKNNGVGEPEFRLPSVMPGTVILPADLLIAVWAVQARVHWIVTDIGIASIGAGIILLFQSIQTYVVDAFTLHAASGELVHIPSLRQMANSAGFGFPLFAPDMYHALGYGKGNTTLAVVAIALGCPAYVPRPQDRRQRRPYGFRPWLFWKHGKQIRMDSKYSKYARK